MSAPSSPASTIQAHRDSVQHLLPTCHRCRRLRRKCDTQLPSCRLCDKAGSECTFYDHALKQTLPRSYVHSLLTRIEQLEAVKKGGPNTSPHSNAETASSHAIVVEDGSPSHPTQTAPDTEEPSLAPTPASIPSSSSFDVVIPSTSTGGRSRYWGSSSAFALTVEVLQHAVTKGFASVEDVVGQKDGQQATEEDETEEEPVSASRQQWGDVDEADIQSLVQLYMTTLNTMYGFVDQHETDADLQAYLLHRRQPGFSTQQYLHGEQAHRFFRVSMIHTATPSVWPYYADAITCVEEVTSEATPASLQALLLLIVFCLFHPRKGDIWKLLDYACRLAVELGYHTEDTEIDPALNASTGGEIVHTVASDGISNSNNTVQNRRSKLRRSTFWGLYAIERIVGQLFGRGSDLQETIITAEYPSSLTTSAWGISPLAAAGSGGRVLGGTETSVVDQAALQSMSIAHHYRLVYLRSEIFRTMYLPASPPDLGLDWLREKHRTLSAWRQELAVSDDLAGVATLTCDVGYDATMCFLFQPRLMKALKATQSPYEAVFREPGGVTSSTPPGTSHSHNTGDNGGMWQNTSTSQTTPLMETSTELPPDMMVASDPFYSAINLIRTYEKIIRAPRKSQRGTYPMTFMSAHYIYLASSTLLAYALLRVDGRVKALRRLDSVAGEGEELSDSEMGTEELDWGAFMDVSTSCLILLAWCVERWPGMLGVLEAYQKLFRRVTRELILKGALQ